jgi:hypothetical protein
MKKIKPAPRKPITKLKNPIRGWRHPDGVAQGQDEIIC